MISLSNFFRSWMVQSPDRSRIAAVGDLREVTREKERERQIDREREREKEKKKEREREIELNFSFLLLDIVVRF